MTGAAACNSSSPRRRSRSCGRRSTATSPATTSPTGSPGSPSGFTEFLTPDGSIVLELGNGWNPGTPTVSTAGIKALLAFQEAAGLHLCQEFICFNPARLPTPAEWVTVRRSRVKDAFTRVWWLSPTPTPKADNRRVLTEYSDVDAEAARGRERTPAASGRANTRSAAVVPHGQRRRDPAERARPAGERHGREPQAILPIPNTASRGAYHDACRAANVPRHPAAMPEPLVEFFVKFLTDPGDVVLDPFAGSNTTGAVAERLERKWIGIEADAEYARASRVRFPAAKRAA